jgi:RNA polymerase sigma factor (TIGR02999 family)
MSHMMNHGYLPDLAENCYIYVTFMGEENTYRGESASDADRALDPARDVTQLLVAWRAGDEAALSTLIEAVYAELRRIARGCLNGEHHENSLQATALVNEAYLRLVDIRKIDWQDRTHFFSMAARVMRRILVDHARSRRTPLHGGNLQRVNFDAALLVSSDVNSDLARLDDALTALAALPETGSRKAQVVEMRYFVGLTAQEIASVLGVSHQTVTNDWIFAKAWLSREMSNKEQRGAAASD